MLLSSVFSAISFASSVPSKVVSVASFSTSTSMLPFSVFSATSFASSVPSKVVSVSSLSFEADDFLILFFGGPLSFTGVTLAFSLILADLLGVSPEPQSNSDTAVPPGCALRYCSNCLLLVISSPVGAVKIISPFLGVPLFLGTNYTSI
ncbi:hypothetical protein OIU84_011387 [Salix udensis]|uniref:Uncharacterized protein n=1 Tax=Salix udensis TaxID=889485 RepID=A0AAD6JP92_9ROSI|nr:hypothetical protein OIU84_011387 [Salix udensis]